MQGSEAIQLFLFLQKLRLSFDKGWHNLLQCHICDTIDTAWVKYTIFSGH